MLAEALRLVGERQIQSPEFDAKLTELVRLAGNMDGGEQIKQIVKDLRDFVLSLPKLSPEVRLLLQDVNLNSGVVPLPIPPQVQAQQVTTHGVPGVLMVDSSMSLGAVIWQTRGIIYVVAGATSSSTQLLDSANSLH